MKVGERRSGYALHEVDPKNGRWKRTVSPYEMSDWHYKKSLAFSEYMESMPEDFVR